MRYLWWFVGSVHPFPPTWFSVFLAMAWALFAWWHHRKFGNDFMFVAACVFAGIRMGMAVSGTAK